MANTILAVCAVIISICITAAILGLTAATLYYFWRTRDES